MTYRGRIKNGAVVLEPPSTLPEGAEVRVEVIESSVSKQQLDQFLEELWEQQRQRGFKSRTREEVDEYLRREKASWDD